jgi:hypothetical protein
MYNVFRYGRAYVQRRRGVRMCSHSVQRSETGLGTRSYGLHFWLTAALPMRLLRFAVARIFLDFLQLLLLVLRPAYGALSSACACISVQVE